MKLRLILAIGIGIFFLRLVPATFASSTIVINEFSSATTSDWVEIYNSSDTTIDLSNYTLTDAANNNKFFDCILAPHGYNTVEWSNKLNNSGDTIYLKKSDVIEDCVNYGNGTPYCPEQSSANLSAPDSNQSAARSPDGGTWQLTTNSTKDAPNNGSSKPAGAVCPTPTPTPSPTPTPTPEPTPKPSSTPKPATATPVSTGASTPTSVPTSILTSTTGKPSSQVLAETDENSGPEPEVNLDIIDLTATDESEINPSPTSQPQKSNHSNLPVAIISAAGIILMIGGGIPLIIQEIRHKKK